MGEEYFNEEQRLTIKKIEKYKTSALLHWALGATATVFSLVFSRIAHENPGDKSLFDALMILCGYSQSVALLCGGTAIYNLIKMLSNKKKYNWLKEAEEKVVNKDKSCK